MTGEVLSNGESSERFDISNGVKQGFVLAPVLFNLYFTQVILHATRDLDLGIYIRYRLDGSLFQSQQDRGPSPACTSDPSSTALYHPAVSPSMALT